MIAHDLFCQSLHTLQYYLTCDNGLASQECTLFNSITADVVAFANGDSTIESVVPIMKLFPSDEEGYQEGYTDGYKADDEEE